MPDIGCVPGFRALRSMAARKGLEGVIRFGLTPLFCNRGTKTPRG